MVTIELAPEDPSASRAESQEMPHSNNRCGDEPEGKQVCRNEEQGDIDPNVQSSGAELHHAKHEDDDWETASEGDDDEDDDKESNNSKSGNLHESFEDALTEDEQKQRALSQANAAKSEGNEFYAAGKYDEALVCYTNAVEVAPEHASSNEIRAMCYSNSAMCRLQLNQYEEAVEQSTKALELNPTYVKAFMRRAQGHEKLDHLEEALADYNKVLELNPGNQQARESARRLEPIVAERREKLKEEMIGKLKDLGNSVLGRFGMSVDNFKAVKDPNTGSYSISFQR